MTSLFYRCTIGRFATQHIHLKRISGDGSHGWMRDELEKDASITEIPNSPDTPKRLVLWLIQ